MAYQSRLELAIDSRSGERSLRRVEKGLKDVDRAGDKADGSMRTVGTRLNRLRSLSIAAGGALAGLTAGAGVLGLVANRASQAAQEIQNFAQLANTTTDEFQRWSFATASVGVQQDKLADILKDVNDRVGEFLQTGSGEMKDFFDQIAPQVGVTADEFARLSGPEALQLYFDSLEKAGASQQEMTFFMESMADEATALIPLLRDNSSELNRLTSEADDLNAILTTMEIQRLKDIRGEFNQLGQQLSTETARAVSQFDELFKASLEGISEGINNVARGFNAFMDDFRDVEAKRSIAGIDAELQRLFDTKRRLEERIDLFGRDAPQSQDSLAALRELKAEYDRLIERKRELQQQNAPVVNVPDPLTLERIAGGLGEISQAETQAAKEADALGQAYRDLRGELRPLEAAQQQYMADKLTLISYAMREGMAVDELGSLLNDLEQSYRSGRSVAEAYGTAGSQAVGKVSDAAQDLGFTFSSGFEDAIVAGKGLRDVLDGIYRDILRIAVRRGITEPLGNAIAGAVGGFMGGPAIEGGFISQVSTGASFAAGGYTGAGGKHDPAGIVHAGEFVVKKSVVDNPGVLPMLSNLNKGYASGGYVGSTSRAPASSAVEVNVYAPPGTQARTEERQTPGGRSIDVIIDEAVAKNISQPGSRTSGALRQRYGASPTLTGR